MGRRLLVLAAVVLIIGLSLLAIQCSTPDYKLPMKGALPRLGKTEGLKGLQGDTVEQRKMPLGGHTVEEYLNRPGPSTPPAPEDVRIGGHTVEEYLNRPGPSTKEFR